VAVDDVHPLKVFSQPLSDRSFSGKIVRLLAWIKTAGEKKQLEHLFSICQQHLVRLKMPLII